LVATFAAAFRQGSCRSSSPHRSSACSREDKYLNMGRGNIVYKSGRRKGTRMYVMAGNLVLTLLLCAAAEERSAGEAQHFWPQWRGALAAGGGAPRPPPGVGGGGEKGRRENAPPGHRKSSTTILGEATFI